VSISGVLNPVAGMRDEGSLCQSPTLLFVECRREYDPDEVRLGLVIASAIEEAEEACRRAYSRDGYASFQVRLVVEGQFPGPMAALLAH
jgi:hypothetical protein